ncbi:tRNA 2-selenouridine(34) synthase MnmH [Metabacillus herbersteinensis]|uniref:tRNA 2-selenouridine(34) synthase MnmH n=1 Tax=Metabacillus herbersteinensis TaxID=283816 RepID=A0ABV6GHA2_9BACI
MFKDLKIDELLHSQDKSKFSLIDVRSPSEYQEMTIPGSFNIPLFDDIERAEVGTLYKRVSVQSAKDRGLEIVAAKLPEFIKQFNQIEGDKVVFCWRGGMRSKTTATVLDLMGIKTFRLQGGVRSYRHWVIQTLEKVEIKPKAYVLNGGTGTGKTAILKRLEKEGYPTLDLEGLANHRGSIFGQIGLVSQNQKTFEALLVQDIERLHSSPFILLEAESKRIGKLLIPDFVMEKKAYGTHIFIEMPMEERVRHILEEYRPWDHHEECVNAFCKIKKHIHTPIAAQIEADLKSCNYDSAVLLLLEFYYDPRYVHTTKQYSENQRITIQANDVDEAVEAVGRLLKSAFTLS